MFYKLKTKNYKLKRGMTYIELIVVLAIFFTMTGVVLTSSSSFQSKVEIKTLSSDIALKIIEAQKSAVSGKLSAVGSGENWRPAYGVYFDLANPKSFIYFTDLNNNSTYETSEHLDTFNITRGSHIESLKINYNGGGIEPTNNASITFTRPSSSATFAKDLLTIGNVSFLEITVSSADDIMNNITVYSSGRIQIN